MEPAKDHHFFSRPPLHGLDLMGVEFVEEAGIPPRDGLQGSGEDELGRLVQPDRYRTVLPGALSRTMGVQRRRRVLDGVPPESLEELVRHTPEEHGVEAR